VSIKQKIKIKTFKRSNEQTYYFKKDQEDIMNNKTYKITIYDPDKVEINGEILNEEATMWKTYKDFKSEDEAKNWLLDHIEIVEMINYPSG
tara:strand:+ start:536 stop:808 length:273 start_codon:yes stop_codon:yes gene_type:complete